jgi:hypothetical protein
VFIVQTGETLAQRPSGIENIVVHRSLGHIDGRNSPAAMVCVHRKENNRCPGKIRLNNAPTSG